MNTKILKYDEFLNEESRQDLVEKYAGIQQAIQEFIRSKIDESGKENVEGQKFLIEEIFPPSESGEIKFPKEKIIDFVKNGQALIDYKISLDEGEDVVIFTELNNPSKSRYVSGRKD